MTRKSIQNVNTNKRKISDASATIKRSRVHLTILQKHNICIQHLENPKLTQEELGKPFGIKANTVSDILKQKEKIVSH